MVRGLRPLAILLIGHPPVLQQVQDERIGAGDFRMGRRGEFPIFKFFDNPLLKGKT